MDFLNGYGSDDEEPVLLSSSNVSTNPIVSTTVLSTSLVSQHSKPVIGSDMVVATNCTVDVMFAPTLGPSHPFKKSLPVGSNVKKIGMGFIESTTIDSTTFDDQYKSFLKSGYAVDSASNAIVGDYEQYKRDSQPPQKRNKTAIVAERKERQMGNIMNSIIDEEKDAEALGAGPWAFVAPVVSDVVSAVAASSSSSVAAPVDTVVEEVSSDPTMHIVEPDEEEEMWEKVNERKRTFNTLPARPARGSTAAEATSTYHGAAINNTAVKSSNRSWVLPPLGVKPEDNTLTNSHACYIPKKCIKKFTGHTKGVQCIELFPQTGHLVLSASLDGKCKIWSLYDDSADYGGETGTGRGLRRTYDGHSEGVRSIDFNQDGSQFLSSSFDRYMRLWDVETGTAVGTFSNRKMGYQAKFAPTNNNLFLMPASDNKVYQWDIRTGGVVLEYNYHLAPCNTVTFFDDGKKFMTTSDDKKILVWEFDTPVPLKQIAEEGMQNVPTLSTHPSKSAIAGQSMDNTIVVYGSSDTIKPLKKKTFKGHNNAGYACQIGFSPNGQFITSGDGFGMLYVWDWKSGKIMRKFQAHDGACLGSQWHPLQPSWLVTCGWDGVIKLWD